MQKTLVRSSSVRKSRRRRDRLSTPVFLASLVAQLVKNQPAMGLIPGLGRSPGEGKGYPLQYSGLENSTDSIVHGVANSRTRLSDFHLRAETVPNPNPNPNPNCSKAPCPQRFSTRMSKSMTWGSDFNASSPWVRWEFSHPFSWMENWSLKHIRTWTCTKSENFKSNS